MGVRKRVGFVKEFCIVCGEIVQGFRHGSTYRAPGEHTSPQTDRGPLMAEGNGFR